MSFWDRLGTLAQDTAGAVTASPKFLWDIATAPWNDDEDFNGFANTFQTAGTKWAQAMLKPVVGVAETPGIKQTLEKWDAFNREYIREPLTTGLLAATETGGDIGKAYGMAQDTSFGQAIVGGLGAVLPGQQAVDRINFEDEAEVDKFFSTGAPRFWSGIGDTGIQIFGDVAIAGGKAAKLARESSLVTNKITNAQKAAKAINDVADAVDPTAGIVNKYTKPIQDFTANGAEYAYNHPMIRKSPMRDTIAYGLGQSTSEYDTALVLRAGLGDQRALEELKTVRASIGNAMERQMGVLDDYQEFLIKKADDPEGVSKLPHEEQLIVKSAMDELEDLRNNDAMFASWEQMAKTPGGVIDRTVGARPMQAVDDFLAKGRSAKFVAGSTRAEAWQPTPFHRMYQVVSWVGNERPAGIVNLNEAESSAEVMAFVNRGHRIAGDDLYSFFPEGADVPKEFKGITDERAAGMMANYYRATTPEDRARAIAIIENAGFSAIAGKHGIDRATAGKIYQAYYRSRLGAQESLRKNGFMIDEDGSVISAPVFESQTANYLPMMDLDLLDSLLKRHRLATKNKPLSVLYGVGNELTGAMDILQSMFKAGVLMRLGYTIRNGTEAQLRIAASVGSMASMRHLGPGLRNMAFNATDSLSARTVDRLSLSSGTETVESTVRSLTKVDSEISELQAKYAEISEQYNKELDEFNKFVPPEDPVFASAKYTDEEVALLDQGILPERFGFNSPEYQKAAKAEAKRLADEHRAVIDEDYLAKQEETVSAFGLNDRDIKLLETKGLIPLNKVLAAYKAGRLNADELSAIVSTGRIEAASVDGLGSEAYQFLDEASLRGMAVRNGKSPQQYIEVPWRRETLDEYVSDGIAQFDAAYETGTIERLVNEYVDEANEWYSVNASPAYSPTTPNVQLESDMRVIEKLIEDKRSLADDYFVQLENLKKSQARGEKRKIGQGKWKVKSFTGEDYDFNDALGGQFADIHRANSSAENSFNTLVDDNAGLVSKSLTKAGYGEVKPDAPNYYQAWAHALNYQFRNSAVAMKLMDNTDPAAVARWLKSDPEGRIVAKRLGLDPWEIDEHVASVKGFVDSYIPSESLRRTLVESTDNAPITPDMLRGIYAGTDGLPTVHGHILEENLTLGSVRNAKNIVNGIFRLIGSMPEDLLARHPLYVSMYRTELKRRVDMFEGLNKRRLTTQEQADLMAVTHKVALRQLKNTLFTIDRKTNLSHYMRLISPFFSAFENTTKTWARIAYEKPQTINRANLIFTSPNRAGIATDENGNPVPPEEASMNDYIWIEVPESLKKVPFIGKGLTSLTEMGIQKKSLDVIFQGEAIHIPVGPYVAVPISEMVKRKPELEKTLSWAIPYGPERSAVRAFLPTWVKRQLTKEDGQSNQQYANTYALIWTTEQHKRREMGQPAATAAEIEKMTDAYYNMRTVANLILPFAPTFQTPYKFYIDQWRQYQEQFGMEAQTKFWQDYGDDFFEFTQSLSKNTTGSFASIGSVGNAKTHADLISELSVIDPKLIGIVTNAGQAYDFSQAAYMWQQANTISPSSSEFYRTRKDPAEAAIDNERSLGWIKYRQVMSGIDSEMQRRGLTNLQSKAAEDLASIKKQMVAQLGAENTAWYDDYLDTDGSKTNRVIRGLETIVSDEKFMSQYGDNPTFKSIAVYLEIRQATEQALASRESKSIDAKANADIKYAFEAAANQLKQQDIGFGDLYDRWLSYDSVYDAVRSQGVAQ